MLSSVAFVMIVRVLLISVYGIQADTGSASSDGGPKVETSILQLQQLINQESMLRLTLDKQLQEFRSAFHDLKSEVALIGESCKTRIPQRINNFESEFRSFRSNMLNATETINDKLSLSEDGLNKLKYNLSATNNEMANSYQTLRGEAFKKISKINRDMSDIRMNMSSLEGQISGVKDSPVYFSAFLGSSFTTKSSNEVIKFGSVTVNVGGGYNPSTGKFTCPKSGAYLLSYGYRSELAKGTLTDMYINNAKVMEASTPGDTSLNSAERMSIHTLTKGDQVHVRVETKGAKLIGGYKYTSFSAIYID